jgi:hypothetical protein
MNERAQKIYDKLYRYRKKNEVEIIHDELFQTTTEYEYYRFGIAQGMYVIYNLLNEYKNNNVSLTIDQVMGVIKICIDNDEKIKGHFNRLIKDLESEVN